MKLTFVSCPMHATTSFFFYSYGDHRDLHSFPTRRSSDLYKDSGTIRAGAQFTPSEKFSARVGGYYDISPVQNGYFAPETPRNDALAGTLGFTYQITPKFGVDFSAAMLYFEETNNSYNHYIEDGAYVSFGGDYRSAAYSLGLGLSYNF